MEKRKITLTGVILALVLVALFGSTYAYFTSNNDPKSSLNAQITTGALSLILDDVDGITEDDKIDANHTEIVKYFKLTNNGVADAYANLIWKGLLNTFVRDDLVYELEEVQADKSSFSDKRMVVTETVVPKTSTNENISLANGILVKAGTISGNTITPNIQYYKLTVKYKYSDTENQNEDLDKVLVSGFDLGEGIQQKVRLTLNIGDGATISSNTADVTYTGTYDNLPIPTKEDYKFDGWYTDSAYTNEITETSMVNTSNTELYAKWKNKNYNGTPIYLCPDGTYQVTKQCLGTQATRIANITRTCTNPSSCNKLVAHGYINIEYSCYTNGYGRKTSNCYYKDTKCSTNTICNGNATSNANYSLANFCNSSLTGYVKAVQAATVTTNCFCPNAKYGYIDTTYESETTCADGYTKGEWSNETCTPDGTNGNACTGHTSCTTTQTATCTIEGEKKYYCSTTDTYQDTEICTE